MKILVIGRSLPDNKSSVGHFEFEQARALSALGNEVTYCFSDDRSIITNHKRQNILYTIDNINIIGFITPIGSIPNQILNIRKNFELNKIVDIANKKYGPYDIVYCHFPLLTLTPSILNTLKAYRLPLCCMEHWTAVKNKRLNKYYFDLLQLAFNYSSAYCCVSDDLKDSIKCLINTNNNTPIYVVPNMVNELIFHQATKIKTSRFEFLFAGRLIKGKNIDSLISSIKIISDNNKDVHLTIAGEGDYTRHLVDRIRSMGLSSVISLVGWQSPRELSVLMNQADCYVSLSRNETFNVPIVEAWMCGCPCIADQSNPLRSYFSRENGLLVDSIDIESTSEAMESVIRLANTFDRTKIAEAAEPIFSSAKVAERINSILNNIIKEGHQ